MKYNLKYKYFRTALNNRNILIEIDKDNTVGGCVYGARANVRVLTEDENFGFACGVGDNELRAMEMCINEINNEIERVCADKNSSLFGFRKLTPEDFQEIILPYKLTVEMKHDKYLTLFIKDLGDKLQVLSNTINIIIEKTGSIEKSIKKYLSKIQYDDEKDFSQDYLKSNDFYPTFDDLTML